MIGDMVFGAICSSCNRKPGIDWKKELTLSVQGNAKWHWQLFRPFCPVEGVEACSCPWYGLQAARLQSHLSTMRNQAWLTILKKKRSHSGRGKGNGNKKGKINPTQIFPSWYSQKERSLRFAFSARLRQQLMERATRWHARQAGPSAVRYAEWTSGCANWVVQTRKGLAPSCHSKKYERCYSQGPKKSPSVRFGLPLSLLLQSVCIHSFLRCPMVDFPQFVLW